MNRNTCFSIPLAVLLLTQNGNPCWGGPPPNPTDSDAHQNTAGGTSVLLKNSGGKNTGFGYKALTANTSGAGNTATGVLALSQNTKGSNNTASGYRALMACTTGSYNTANGAWALNQNATGYYNTASGIWALYQNTIGNWNTATGALALNQNTEGSSNTANGYRSLMACTTGNYNTASGAWSLYHNTTGNYNIATGYEALFSNTTGSGNTALGYLALITKTTGSNNLAVGQKAGINLTSGSNNIYIENGGAAAESSTIRIGNVNHKRTFVAGIRGKTTGLANAVNVMIDSNGQLGTINSSHRFKKDIRDMNDASRGLLQLRPVMYRYQQTSEDGTDPLEYGLIAEEVVKVYPDLVAYGADGQVETVQYHKLTPMLLNEVQHLNTLLQAEKHKVKTQQEELRAEQIKNQQQAQEIASLKQQMAQLQTQAQRIETLASRLSRIEAQRALGMANKNLQQHGRNPG